MANKNNLLGSWAFLVGVLLALIVGIVSGLQIYDLGSELITTILVILGIIIGLFNITSRESMPFLLSGVSLIIASVFGLISGIMNTIPVASSMLMSLLAIFIPATIIVAIRNVFSLSKN